MKYIKYMNTKIGNIAILEENNKIIEIQINKNWEWQTIKIQFLLSFLVIE